MITVYYSGNKRIFKGILLSVMSMVKYTDEALSINLLTMDLTGLKSEYQPFSESQVSILNQVLQEKNADSVARLIDMTSLYNECMGGGKNEKNMYTPYTLLRLLLTQIDTPDKAIYLDADTMLSGDIAELYDIDIEGYEYGAVLDHMGKFWVARDYCNAGVLLLNFKQIRCTGLFDKSIQYMATHKLIMPDQSAIYRNTTRKLILPRRFNEQRAVAADTVVKHFNKGIRYFPFFHIYNVKQWEIEKVHSKLKIFAFDDVFEEYKALVARCDIDK